MIIKCIWWEIVHRVSSFIIFVNRTPFWVFCIKISYKSKQVGPFPLTSSRGKFKSEQNFSSLLSLWLGDLHKYVKKLFQL